ncbi:MAG: hypothetical protein IJP70_07845 [Bacteroidales bacterium]|nr:hypothetical protein [Bacteroidales bacterium]
MNIKHTITVALFATILLAACSNPEAEKAEKLYTEAEKAYTNSDWFLAAEKLDSIENGCKTAIEWRKKGHSLNYKVQLAIQEDSLATADTMLIALTRMINEMVEQQHFVFEKTENDEIGRFYIKGTDVTPNKDRCYIHASVDEYGHTQLISEYRGSAYINHTQLRFTGADGSQVSTAVVPLSNDGANYHFKNQGVCHETVTYVNDPALQFVGTHATDKKLRAHLLYKDGQKQYFVELSEKDRLALAYTYQLSKLLAAQLLYSQRSQVAGKKIQFLKAKIETYTHS